MDTSLFSFWAKTAQSDRKDQSIEFHPLIYHLLDVAACAEASIFGDRGPSFAGRWPLA